jgi:hypothetical protein
MTKLLLVGAAMTVGLVTPAPAQSPACETLCSFEAVLRHIQTTTPRPIALDRGVSTHDACAADNRACQVSLGDHDEAVIRGLTKRGLIVTAYEIIEDSIHWDEPIDSLRPLVSVWFAPLVEEPAFDASQLPSDAHILPGATVGEAEEARWYRVGVVVSRRSDITSFWYWVRRTADGACEAIYEKVTGMV